MNIPAFLKILTAIQLLPFLIAALCLLILIGGVIAESIKAKDPLHGFRGLLWMFLKR